jgi:DNA-directed RNA polymerase subunit F
MEVKSSKAVTVGYTQNVLSKREKDGELGYEQAQALDHSKKFSKERTKKIETIVEALIKHEKITEELAVKIIDIAPENPATLKTILAKDRIEISEEEAASILKEII